MTFYRIAPSLQRLAPAFEHTADAAAIAANFPSKLPRIPSDGVRFVRTKGNTLTFQDAGVRRSILFVISGKVRPDGSRLFLGRGDVGVLPAGPRPDFAVDGDCRLLELDVPDSWSEGAATAAGEANRILDPTEAPQLSRIVTMPDGTAAFCPLDGLFPDERGTWSDRHPVLGFRLTSVGDGVCFGFHPESAMNLAAIVVGELELRVGSGEARTFRAGDLCVAADTSGAGHVNRFRGHTEMLVISLAPRNVGAEEKAGARSIACPPSQKDF